MAKNKINVVIVDDQQLFLDTMVQALNNSEQVHIVGAVRSSKELFNTLDQQQVDLVLLDVEIPSILGDDGFQIAQKLKDYEHSLKIISMSVNTQSFVIRRLIKDIKVDGFIDKNTATLGDLGAIIQIIMEGHFYIDKALEKRAFRILDIEKLTPREKEITELIVKNHTNYEIAEKLNIKPKTVDNHRQNIFLKLKCTKVSELASQYYRFLYLHNEDLNHLPNFKQNINS